MTLVKTTVLSFDANEIKMTTSLMSEFNFKLSSLNELNEDIFV